MKARELVVDLERGSALEVDPGALDAIHCPRDFVTYFLGLDPQDRPTDVDLISAEITAALGRPAAAPQQRLTALLDPVAPQPQWRQARTTLGMDCWPGLVERPLLGAPQLAIVAAIPIIIFFIALTITEAMVVAVLSGILVAAWIGAFVLNRMKERRTEVDPPSLTLGDLAERISARRRELAGLPAGTLKEAAVLQKVTNALAAHSADMDLDSPFER